MCRWGFFYSCGSTPYILYSCSFVCNCLGKPRIKKYIHNTGKDFPPRWTWKAGDLSITYLTGKYFILARKMRNTPPPFLVYFFLL